MRTFQLGVEQGETMARVSDHMTPAGTLPKDGTSGALAGRVWLPERAARRGGGARRRRVRHLAAGADHARSVRGGQSGGHRPRRQGRAHRHARCHSRQHAGSQPRCEEAWLLAPCDLQALKAAGVTFPLSMLERVIEEQARGSPEKAEAIRRACRPSSAATSARWCRAARRRPS
jgi:fumarylacetoacetate (FAA) hydrolase family protein